MITNLIWEPPDYKIYEWLPKRTRYCFIVVVWNEGERFKNQLERMRVRAYEADIIVADRRSIDGSTSPKLLMKNKVRTLLVTDEPGRCTSIRMAIAYAIRQKYEGVVFVDGNGKDGVDALPYFIKSLDEGYDLIQGSRFIKGGYHKNTPPERYLAIRFVLSPILSFAAGFFFTDPANGFRACSMRYLKDERVQPIRKEFVWDNLQLYLCYRAAKLCFKVKEIPVSRVYPDVGSIPTKVVSFKTKFRNLWEMFLTASGAYNPK